MAKKTLLVCLAITALLALTAGVALAEKTQGPDAREAGPGADVTRGLDGSDDRPGRDSDTFYAPPGGRTDEAYCGDGSETAHASPENPVADDCETDEPVGNP